MIDSIGHPQAMLSRSQADRAEICACNGHRHNKNNKQQYPLPNGCSQTRPLQNGGTTLSNQRTESARHAEFGGS